MSSKTTDSIDSTCTVCSEQVTTYAVGRCDHPICYRCSTRMRVLCEQFYCAICRTNMPKVVFIKKLHKFGSLKTHNYLLYHKSNIYFENQETQRAFFDLLENRCNICKSGAFKPFRTFNELQQHMRRDHNLFYCDICVKHLKMFPGDRKTYDRKKLAQHRRTGDEDDKSHKGHPLCQFCDERYLDNDELAKHLRKDHFYCHFCDADGISNQFYGDYPTMKDHFRNEHFLCEEGECEEERFSNAFRYEIDLKAHVAQQHTKNMRRAQAKQARTIELDINLAPRHRGRQPRDRGQITGDDYQEGGSHSSRHGGGRGRYRPQRDRYDREQQDLAKAVSASLNEMERHGGHVNIVSKDLVQAKNKENIPAQRKYEGSAQDFPTLDGQKIEGSSSSDEEDKKQPGLKDKSNMAKRFAMANNFSVQDGNLDAEEFPTLGGGGKVKKPHKNSAAWANVATPPQPRSVAAPPQPRSVAPASQPRSRVPNDTAKFGSSQQTSQVGRHSPSMQSSPAAIRKTAAPPVSSNLVSVPPSSSTLHTKQSAEPVSNVTLQSAPAFSQRMNSAGTSIKQESFSQRMNSAAKNIKQEDFPTLSSIGNLLLGKPQSEPAGAWAKSTSKAPEKQVKEKRQKQNSPEKRGSHLAMYYDRDVSNLNSDHVPKKAPMAQSTSDHVQKKASVTPSPSEYTKPVDYMEKESGLKIVGEEFPTLDGVVTESQATKAPQWASKSKHNKDKKNERGKGEVRVVTVDTNAQSNKKKFTGGPSSTDSTTMKEKKDDKEEKTDTNQTRKDKAAAKESAAVKTKPEEEAFTVAKSSKGKDNSASNKKSKKKAKASLAASVDDDMFDYCIRVNGAPTNPSTKQVVTAADKMKPKAKSETEEPNEFKVTVDSSTAAVEYEDIYDKNVTVEELAGIDVGEHHSGPPPGFGVKSSSAKPPPGFTNTKKKAPPPGFVKGISDFPPDDDLLSTQYTFQYQQPEDVQQRNQKLIDDIIRATRDDDTKFPKFKNWSGLFRQNGIDAEEYYNRCEEIIGPDRFVTIFPELLALLPDIGKQQELLRVHQNVKMAGKGKRAWTDIKEKAFRVCQICGQVLLPADINMHAAGHNLDTEFPSLGGPVGSNAWVKAK